MVLDSGRLGQLRRCSRAWPWLDSLGCPCLRTTWIDLIGTPMASIVRSAIVMGSEVDGLAAKGAAVVDQRLMLLNSHGKKRRIGWW